MAKQTITLRLDEDDLTYLAGLELPGATNLSEKIRALLADARQQREGLDDFRAAYDFACRLLSVTERRIRDLELREEMRSEFLSRVLAWLPDIVAVLLANGSCAEGDQVARLLKLERVVGERILGLVDSVVQQARAGFPGCYDSQYLSERVRSALTSIDRSGVSSTES